MKRNAGTGGQAGAIELVMRVARAADGRLEGTINKPEQTEGAPFSGTLDLLRALEVALEQSPENPRPAADQDTAD